MEKTNKIIAEFMGNEKFWLMLERHNGIYPNFNKTYYQSGNDKTIDKPLKEDYVFKHIVKFHSSWDWLMPVIEKCLVGEAEQSEEISNTTIKNIYEGICNQDISFAYKSVVEFIKEYKKYPFNEGDDYYTIEDDIVIWSCWDDESEELHDENPSKQYFKTKKEAENYNLN